MGQLSQILDLRSHCTGNKVAIIADIHGCYYELGELLDAIDWSPQSYILILTGDLIDRGIRPDRPINRQQKDHCIYIRTWNPKTKKISNEGIDPWWYEYSYLYSSQRHHSPPSIKIFFGHQRHDKVRVSDWACALDGSIVFGATL